MIVHAALLAVLVGTTAVPPPAAAGQPPAPLAVQDYIAELETVKERLASTDATGARRLEASLPASHRVAVGGAVQEFSFDWLKAALRQAPPDEQAWRAMRGGLLDRLRATESEAARVNQAPPAQVQPARRTLQGVLSQRAFAGARQQSWQAELRRRFDRWLADLWARTLGRRVGQRTVALVLAWIVAAGAVIVLLAWMARAAARRRVERPLALGTPEPPRLPGHVLALQAVALFRAGDTREAARIAYRAAVHRLEEEGALKIDETRTPREYLALLPARHERRAPLARMTSAFERTWYGSRPATAEERGEILGLLRDLECLSRDPVI